MSSGIESARLFRIAIIGGGVSGALVAAHLLKRSASPTEIILVEKREEIGPGTAYATRLPAHLLNVPAARMSLWPDQPDDFIEWACMRAGAPGWAVRPKPEDFLPRSLFGEYVADRLASAEAEARPEVILKRVQGEAVDLDERPVGGAHVVLASGESFSCDRVVLALGNLPSAYPLRKHLSLYRTRRYAHVPWADDALTELDPEATVLVVGQGLTAVDIITALVAQGHRGPIVALARRGLRPHAHLTGVAPYPSFLDPASAPLTLRGLLRRVREEIANAASQGIDWRPVVDSLRPHLPALWQKLPLAERARFLRHLRPYWEIHRHRLAPALHRRLELLVESGRVSFKAGRIERLLETPAGVEAVVRRRSDGAEERVIAARIVNCTGPRTDYSKYQHPLLVNLLSRGLIDHDPLALGLATTPEGGVLRYGGAANPWLFTLGPPMRGTLWECTAVPEIRVQAAALVGHLLPD